MGILPAYQNEALFELAGAHLLPLWDEKLLIAFREQKDSMGRQSLNPATSRLSIPFPGRQRRLGNVNVDDSLLLLKECLRDNQAYFLLNEAQAFRVSFPYAWYMKQGDKITNLTTGEEYTVAHIYDDRTHDVLLSGKRSPRSTDRLRLLPENEIFVNHGSPRAFSKGHKYSEEGSVADKPAPWTNTITYIVTRSEPGSLSDNPPFQGTRQFKPQFREAWDNPVDPVMTVATDGWLFDNLVQFDCWAQTNAEAVKLLKWFEDFMLRHAWIMELYGVAKVLYWMRDEDKEVPVWRNDITKRTVIYYFRTERVFVFQTRKLSHVSLEVAVDMNEGPVPERFTEVIPDPSTTADWPEPTSSVDARINE